MTSSNHFKFLQQAFPRIAERVELLWGSPECEEYLCSLIVMDRSNRRGFPKDVIVALIKLFETHVGDGSPLPPGRYL